MINDDEKKRREIAYEIAKKHSESRGVVLTQETEAIMNKYINGEISDQEFFTHVTEVAKNELMRLGHLH